MTRFRSLLVLVVVLSAATLWAGRVDAASVIASAEVDAAACHDNHHGSSTTTAGPFAASCPPRPR